MAINRAKRRLLFYTLILVFLIITPLMIALAVGYNLNLKAFSFFPTGGIFVKTNQTGVDIWLDGELIRETSFLISGALLSNVPVGTHNARIDKEGYRSWEKNISVHKGMVSEYRAVMMIPISAPVISASENIYREPFHYYLSPDGLFNAILLSAQKKLVIKEVATGQILFEKNFAVLPPAAEWIDDANLFLHSTYDDSETLLFRKTANDSFEEIKIKFLKTLKRQIIAKIRPYPADKNFIFILGKDNTVYRYKIANGFIEPIIKQALYFEIFNERIYFVTEKGFFASAALNGSDIQIIERPGFFLNGSFVSYPSEAGGVISLTDGTAGFFIFQNTDNFIKPVTAGIHKVVFSKNNTKALLKREHDLAILFITKENIMPFRDKLTLEKIIPDQKSAIIDSVWYANDYVLFTTNEGLFGAEIGIKSNDYMVQKISNESGHLATDGKIINIINEKGIFRYAIE